MSVQPTLVFPGTERFKPLALLGQGGMGDVYRAFDAQMQREVALKTIRNTSAENIYSLKREFRSLTEVSHPNLIELYDLVVGDLTFFTMELIEGQDFVRHVRQGREVGHLPDMPRLFGALAQLVHGVHALHRLDLLHRDLKPSNVLVRKGGTVVLLDFGLVTSARPNAATFSDRGLVVGTLMYIAPEGLAGDVPTHACDWYAVGVILFEALTGALPFDGSPVRVLEAKRAGRYPDPCALAPDCPPALADLTRELLRAEPGTRPRFDQICAYLDNASVAIQRVSSLPPEGERLRGEPAFVGRESELGQLKRAFESRRDAQPVIAEIHGGSGIGKTALIAEFVHRLRGEPRVLVLNNRCHPSENVAYKAFDGIVDQLSRFLLGLSDIEVQAYLPRRTPALLRLFPVLGRVPAIAAWQEDLHETSAEHAHEQRRAGILALRELIARIAERRPLILWIDDVQWAEADSATLLKELLRPPDAPQALIILSFRTEERQRSPCLDVVDHPAPGFDVRVVDVEVRRLGSEEVTRMVEGIFGDLTEVLAAHIDSIEHESGGMPFLVGELSRHVMHAHAAGLSAAQVRLTGVVKKRLEGLPDDSRQLLELVAISGRPIRQEAALEAASLNRSSLPCVAQLRKLLLVRASPIDELAAKSSGFGGESSIALEPYHDKIRDAVLDSLPLDRRRGLHKRLAEVVLRAPAPDPELVLEHLCSAGEFGRAAPFALEAAERAAAGLAFDRAAQLYALAIELGCDSRPVWKLHEARGQALVNDGRMALAGDAFAAAAEVLEREQPAASDVARLRRRAAEQYLHGGKVTEGLALVGTLLAGVGVELPESPRGQMSASLRRRLWFFVRGPRYKLREVQEVSPALIHRLDTMWSFATSLSMINHTVCETLAAQHLLEALDLGERSRLIRALALEAASEANIGGAFLVRRSERQLEEAKKLLDGSKEPYDHAWFQMSAGCVRWFRAEWKAALEHLERAEAIFREQCTGARWERTINAVYLMTAKTYAGRLREVDQLVPEGLLDAEQRGDLFAANLYKQGAQALIWLAVDEPDLVLSLAKTAMSAIVGEDFRIPHYHHLGSTVRAHLYMGQFDEAREVIEAAWPRLTDAQFLLTAFVGSELRFLRALAAVARRDLETARSEAKKIAKTTLPTSAPFADVINAGVAADAADAAAVKAALTSAAVGFDRAGMDLYRQCVRYQLGAVSGDESVREGAAIWLTGQGVVKPGEFSAMMVPGVLR